MRRQEVDNIGEGNICMFMSIYIEQDTATAVVAGQIKQQLHKTVAATRDSSGQGAGEVQRRTAARLNRLHS
jgi:hypothetical protein